MFGSQLVLWFSSKSSHMKTHSCWPGSSYWCRRCTCCCWCTRWSPIRTDKLNQHSPRWTRTPTRCRSTGRTRPAPRRLLGGNTRSQEFMIIQPQIQQLNRWINNMIQSIFWRSSMVETKLKSKLTFSADEFLQYRLSFRNIHMQTHIRLQFPVRKACLIARQWKYSKYSVPLNSCRFFLGG